MMLEFAKNRIAKIRIDYSKQDLNNKLGLINNKENESSEDFIYWVGIK